MLTTFMNVPLTLDRLLERAGSMFPKVEIITRRPDRSLHRSSYGDMYRRARQLAQALTRAGLKPGERVATLCWNHWVHQEAYFGVPAAAGVLHTLNLRLYPEDIAYIANHAQDRFLIVDDVLLPLFEKFRDKVKFERIFVVPFGGDIQHDYEDYESFIAEPADNYQYPQIDEQAACGMCYTSGTTGHPKGVAYGHRATVLHTLGMLVADATGLSMRDTVVPVVPLFHANGWGLPYAAPTVGSRLVFPGPFLDAESLLDLFSETGVTFAGGVPTIWMGILQALRKEPKRWTLTPGMKMLVGGSATPPSLIEGLAEFDLEILCAWGLTETGPLASICRLRPELDALSVKDQYKVKARAGLPVPLVELRIRNDDGIAPWDGRSVGEIEAYGPWITGSYYNRPDEAPSASAGDKKSFSMTPAARDRFADDGWFKTGDIAFMTADGYINITDRAKDLIKSGGEWISSQDLENELMAHPAVAEAVVIAIPHEKWMERPLAVVVKKPDVDVSKDELRAHLKGKFADWWLPDDYAFIDQIPRTSTGKFQKLKVREMFADWSPGESATSRK